MLDQLLKYDTELFIYLNSLGSSTWDPFWMAYTAKFNWIPLYAILLFLIFKHVGKRNIVITVAVVALMILFTDQVANLFKHGMERPRPCHVAGLIDTIRIVKPGCGGRFGFFSGHAANAMATAVFVGLILRKRFKYLLYMLLAWAFLMAYSRVYIGVHYPLDITVGMMFGAISGYMFYRLYRYLTARLVKVQ